MVEDAQILSDESAEGNDPGRIRAAYDRVRARLDGITTVTAGLTTLAAQGQAACQAVFGTCPRKPAWPLTKFCAPGRFTSSRYRFPCCGSRADPPARGLQRTSGLSRLSSMTCI